MSLTIILKLTVTNFIYLVSSQLVDWFSETKLHYKAPNESYLHIWGCTKAITNDWDIRPSVAVKASSTNISWTDEWIHTIELALESAH